MSLLKMEEITKVFPGVVANDHISFDLEAGEVHALVGENGAGKTTLMKILYGLYGPDEGRVLINDEEVRYQQLARRDREGRGYGTPALHAGAGFQRARQRDPRFRAGDRRRTHGRRGRSGLSTGSSGGSTSISGRRDDYLRELIERNRLDVDLDRPVGELAVGIQQRVEILKILYRGAKVLVFDEPTAVLSPQEIDGLYESFHQLTDQGKGVIFISHKLDEVLKVADRITVIRRGKVIETMPREGATKEKIAELMVGKPVMLDVENPPAEPREAVLEVDELSAVDERGTEVLSEVSLQVRRRRDRRDRRCRGQRTERARLPDHREPHRHRRRYPPPGREHHRVGRAYPPRGGHRAYSGGPAATGAADVVPARRQSRPRPAPPTSVREQARLSRHRRDPGVRARGDRGLRRAHPR